MAIGRAWAGRIFGTNTGNVFVRLSGSDDNLTGKIHINDTALGVAVYLVSGSFNGTEVVIEGGLDPAHQNAEIEGGTVTATAKLNERGELRGEWSNTIGTAGTLELFPHDQDNLIELRNKNQKVPRLHTARYSFGAVALNKLQIVVIAKEIQAEFEDAEIVVTVTAETEQSRMLGDFEKYDFGYDKANSIKLFIQQLGDDQVSRTVTVELGPYQNQATVQGGDEAWVLGFLEKIKRSIKQYERTYATNIKKFGFGINQVLLFGAIVYLPSLGDLEARIFFMIGILLIMYLVDRMHKKVLPETDISLVEKTRGVIKANLMSWGIAFTSAVCATLLASYLQGNMHQILSMIGMK